MGFLGGIARCLYAIIGPGVMLLYPLYESVKAMESPSPTDDQHWLTYWISYSFITSFELLCWTILQRLPYWPYMKLVFCVWLVLPKFNGTGYIYENFVKKYVKVAAHDDHQPEGFVLMVAHDGIKWIGQGIQQYGPAAFDASWKFITGLTKKEANKQS